MSNNIEWCSDLLLEIMFEILHQAADLKKSDEGSTLPQNVYDSLLVNFKAFIKLLSASDVVINLNFDTNRASSRKPVRIFWPSFTFQ